MALLRLFLVHLTLARKVEMEKFCGQGGENFFHFNYFLVHSGQKCEPTVIFLAISASYLRPERLD